MLFSIEFGKLFRRKFNYLFAIILILLNLGFAYKLSTFSTFFDIMVIPLFNNGNKFCLSKFRIVISISLLTLL